jgi:hypothetical protein
LDVSLYKLHYLCHQFSFEIDSVFVDLSIHSILFEISFHPNTFPLTATQHALGILHALARDPTNGFTLFFVSQGIIPLLASTFSDPQTTVFELLIEICQECPEAVAIAIELLPLSSIQPLFPAHSKAVLALLSALSRHPRLPNIGEWIAAVEHFLQIPALPQAHAVDILFLAANLCKDASSAAAICALPRLIGLINEILSQYPLAPEEEEISDSIEIMAVLAVVDAFGKALGDSFPEVLDLNLLLKALDGQDESVVQHAAEVLAGLMRLAPLRRVFLGSNIIAYLELCLELNGFETTRHAVAMAVLLVQEAGAHEMGRLVEYGCVTILIRGIDIDDAQLQAAVFRALEALMRNAPSDGCGRNALQAEFERAGGFEALDAAKDEFADAPEELDAAVRSFLTLYAELDPR